MTAPAPRPRVRLHLVATAPGAQAATDLDLTNVVDVPLIRDPADLRRLALRPVPGGESA